MPGYTSSSTSLDVVTVTLALRPDGVSWVTSATYREPLCLRWALPTAGWFHTTSEGMTPPSSLLRAHAPHHPPLADFVALYRESLQVVTSPCWTMVVPDVISACLSLDAWTPTPAAWWVHLPLTSPPPSAFPQSLWVGASQTPLSDFRAGVISGLQSFADVQASRFAATQVAPTAGFFSPWAAVAFTSEQNTGRYLPVHRICSPSEWAIDGGRTSTFLDMQPCRLLRGRTPWASCGSGPPASGAPG
jgi:hypothetical protein